MDREAITAASDATMHREPFFSEPIGSNAVFLWGAIFMKPRGHQMQREATSELSKVLFEDVTRAIDRVSAADTQTDRRDYVRSAFSAMEGIMWQLKREVRETADQELSDHERSALLEEVWHVDDRGKVKVTPKYVPLTTSIRLIERVVQRYSPTFALSLNSAGWESLVHGVELRNRITHPKSKTDLAISDEEIGHCDEGFRWLMDAVCSIRTLNSERLIRETRELTELTKQMEALEQGISSGQPLEAYSMTIARLLERIPTSDLSGS